MKELQPETINMIDDELKSIPEKYQKDFNSIHEGYAVILEEVRELEQEVFFGYKPLNTKWQGNSLHAHVEHRHNMQKECVQIAAMCARFIQELTKL